MPTPQPVAVTTGTYTNLNTSGITQTSGISGAYAGPWFIMRQTMEIDYVRVPRSWYEDTPSALPLSAPMDRSTTVGQTQLQYIVRANVTIEKSYETFDTSAYQQPQKFAILAQVDDQFGNTYGDLSAGQGSPSGPGILTLGPRGKVVTDQPYYNRRLWTDADDSYYAASGYTEGFEGTRGSFTMSATVPAPNGSGQTTAYIFAEPYDDHFGQFDHSLRDSKEEHTWLHDWEPSYTQYPSVPSLNFGGTYSTAQESDAAVKNWIDSVGVAIATPTEWDHTSIFNFAQLTGYAKMWPQPSPNLQNTYYTTNAPSWLNYPMQYYKASRHDWS